MRSVQRLSDYIERDTRRRTLGREPPRTIAAAHPWRGEHPAVAYVRGSYLNPFETQYLEPLLDRFDITAVYPRSHRFDVRGLEMPRVRAAVSRLSQWSRAAPARGTCDSRTRRRASDMTSTSSASTRALPGLDIAHAAEQTFTARIRSPSASSATATSSICLQAEVNPFWAEGHGRVLGARRLRACQRGSVHRPLGARAQRACWRGRR